MALDMDLDDLRAELEPYAQPEKKKGLTAREERIIAGFEDIQRFYDQQGRLPQSGEDRNIFERLYAVRLERLIGLEACQSLLAPLDHQGLLTGSAASTNSPPEVMDDDALLAELQAIATPSDITQLRHVRSRAEVQVADEIANRTPCEDFERFQPLFRQLEAELKAQARRTLPFGRDASIEKDNFFILGGQYVYVAEVGDTLKAPNGENDARLRVIYANGTESNLLRRSLQRALYKDEASRRITGMDDGPLFSDTAEEEDVESGTIYVLRSLSDHPYVAEHRALIHKIGVTSGRIESRIANAAHEATYLLAEVEVVASYKLVGINRTRLEKLLHRVFASAQLSLTIEDRFGHPVHPREWFLVPLPVIDQVVEHIRDGSITGMIYDPATACLVSLMEKNEASD